MQTQIFVTVAQRRILTIDDALLPLFGPLFAIETHMTMEERIRLVAPFAAMGQRLCDQPAGAHVGHGEL